MSGWGEEKLHAIFRSSFVRRKGILGPGEDCAALEPPPGATLLQTVDQVIGGVHLEEDAPAEVFAQKLLLRSLSDLAAAGAIPWCVSWTLAIPANWEAKKVQALAHAFLATARAFDLPVVGGDCSQAPVVVLTCTALGLASGPVPGRGGAQPGDVICVSGRLGHAVRSGAHRCPQPRLREGQHLVQHYHPHAMMDLSDGLMQDLPRILRASGVGACVELTDLPLRDGCPANEDSWQSAVAEGEDYELLAVLAAEEAEKAEDDPMLSVVGFTAIGKIQRQAGLVWLQRGEARTLKGKGWEVEWSSRSCR